MTTKPTLTIEKEIIERAKSYVDIPGHTAPLYSLVIIAVKKGIQSGLPFFRADSLKGL